MPELIPVFPVAGMFTPHCPPAPDRFFRDPRGRWYCPVSDRVSDEWEPRLAKQRAIAERERLKLEAEEAAKEAAEQAESNVVYEHRGHDNGTLKGGLG